MTRRAFGARMWLFELECGALVAHSHHSANWNTALEEWVEGEASTRFGILTLFQAHQRFVRALPRERMVKGSGPLCSAFDRKTERVIWRGFHAHRVGAPLKGPRFWQPTQTRLCLNAGCEI